jgi:AGCS family alanine or glycine:cation symporter
LSGLDAILLHLKTWVWGIPLLSLLLGAGIYLTFTLRGVQFRYLGYAFSQVFQRQKKDSKGDISPFDALMTSLAGAIGTGTIVGVATAVTVGGFGAIFWMWITALFGMATKYAESLLAVRYREVDSRGEMMGGPMQYMEKGLGWKKAAMIFAFFGAVAAIGTGNLVQVNAIGEAMGNLFSLGTWATGVIFCVFTGIITLGGVRVIGRVAGFLVPIMAVLYLCGGGFVLLSHWDKIGDAFMLIFQGAFTPQAALGGTMGGALLLVIREGVSRSVFSNEAGLGISSICAGAAKTDNPGRQAMITMTGALISTLIICTLTGLVLAVTGVVSNEAGMGGASLAFAAFESTASGLGVVVSIGLILFAFSTLLAWAYYGEKCAEYLFGVRAIIPYRIVYALLVIPGAALELSTVWYIADIFNGLMAIPNLLALIFLKPVLVKETNTFLEVVKKEQEVRVG